MSNTSKGAASKGSKHWMQAVVKDNALRARLEDMMGEKTPLCWISPLKSDDYSEYRLNSPSLYNRFETTKEDIRSVLSFWPSGGPNWDGLAMSNDTLFLMEAKSHLAEMRASCRAKSRESRGLIQATMKEVQERYYPHGDYSDWEKEYYQLANRLVFLHKLNEKAPFGKIKKVTLVLLNFVNDTTHEVKKRTSEDMWRAHYKEVWRKMAGSETTPDGVINLFFDVGQK